MLKEDAESPNTKDGVAILMHLTLGASLRNFRTPI